MNLTSFKTISTMNNNINNKSQQSHVSRVLKNSALKWNQHFSIPSIDGIPILKLNEVTNTISMYKMLTLIAFSGILAVMAIGYVHLF